MNYRINAAAVKRARFTSRITTPPPPARAGAAGSGRVAYAAVVVTTELPARLAGGGR
jgi:hypothetical protein